jgi:hypothetical protein
MDWQQLVSLVIVGATAAVLLWSRFRRRKFNLGRNAGCGCYAVSHSAISQQRVVFRARKGERPQVIIQMK